MPAVIPTPRAPRPSRWACALLLLALTVPVVAIAASAPHSHAGTSPGLYNQEHDFTLLATASAVALPGAPPLLGTIVVVARVTPTRTHRPPSAARCSTDSRAPPIV